LLSSWRVIVPSHSQRLLLSPIVTSVTTLVACSDDGGVTTPTSATATTTVAEASVSEEFVDRSRELSLTYLHP
jgi:hypothetical protein